MDHDTYEFWYGKSMEEQEESVEKSIIALSRRKLKLLDEIQQINIHIEQLRDSIK